MRKNSPIEDIFELAIKNPIAGLILSVTFACFGFYLTSKSAPVGAKPADIVFLPLHHFMGSVLYMLSVVVLFISGIGYVVTFIKQGKEKRQWQQFRQETEKSRRGQEEAERKQRYFEKKEAERQRSERKRKQQFQHNNNDLSKYFQILEVEPNVSFEEVKSAYKCLVQVWHPDRFAHKPDLQRKADEKLKEINVAFDNLKAYYHK